MTIPLFIKSMKQVTSILILSFLASILLADEPIDINSLPSNLYIISEGQVPGKPEQTSIHCINRDGKSAIVLFGSLSRAEDFLKTKIENKSLSPFAFRRAALSDFLEAGSIFILDPVSSEAGGSIFSKQSLAQQYPDNKELKTLFSEDQADRTPQESQKIDWVIVSPRDAARKKRTMEMILAHQLHTDTDYWNAAFILQHGNTPDDYLLAHELAIVALKKGKKDAIWLVAATEDRFLQNISRLQRFGTQLSRRIETDGKIDDNLRSEFNVPTVAESEKMYDTVAK
jgi:hypothetical protein